MICAVFSGNDIASKNIAEHIVRKYGFDEVDGNYVNGNIEIREYGGQLTELSISEGRFDAAYMLSMHRSAAGVGALTTHSTGNFTLEAKLGGKPRSLSISSPLRMLAVLRRLWSENAGIEKSYEATHHGPLLEIPSLFVELGGNDEAINNKALAGAVGDAVYSGMSEGDIEYEKAVIGIGGGHYPRKFTRIAVEKGYAFGHIMPRYSFFNYDGTDNFSMIGSAAERSDIEIDAAVIEKKGVSSAEREAIIKELDRLGMEYEMV